VRLSYSSYRMYVDCPRSYKLKADKVEPPEPDNRYFALYGLLVEHFFERYTNRLCRADRVLTDKDVNYLLSEMWKGILAENYVNWDEPYVRKSSNDIYEMALEDVLENMKTFSFWKNAQAEVPYWINLKKSGDALTCRMDFVVKLPDDTVEILDGKGKMKIDTDADIEQLYYYALVYLLKNGRLPDKIGFLYYHFKIIRYIDFDADAIMAFRDKLALVKSAMKKDTEFAPKVKLSKQCKWCSYKYTCDAWRAKKDANAAKKGSVLGDWGGSILDLKL
jgi:CRISPR/Cas system-associated exonuclease Cas4 (RecB family)